MLSFQKKNEAEALLNALNEKQEFFLVLKDANSYFQELCSVSEGINHPGFHDPSMPPDSPIAEELCHEIYRHLSDLFNSLNKYSLRKYYQSLEAVQSCLESSFALEIYEHENVKNILTEMDEFSMLYEKYSVNNQWVLALPLVLRASKLLSMLVSFKQALSLIADNFSLNGTKQDHENTKHLSLILTSSMSVDVFAQKLMSIHLMYEELCYLTNISPTDYPLVINKVESGSLWVDLIGNEKIVTLMVGFISGSALFIFRKYTEEGKWSALPKKIEAVDAILELTMKLEAAGLDVSEPKDKLAKANFTIVKQLNTLIGGEKEVIVNNSSYSLEGELQKKLSDSENRPELSYNEELNAEPELSYSEEDYIESDWPSSNNKSEKDSQKLLDIDE